MSYFIYKYQNQTLKMNQSRVCMCVCMLGEDIKKRDIFKNLKTIQNIKEQAQCQNRDTNTHGQSKKKKKSHEIEESCKFHEQIIFMLVF